MNNKERLEEIKKHRNEADNSTDEYEFEKINFYNLHVDWLIEQAELVGYFARKNGELNEFLNKYIEPKHLGKNVIDVAMDIIVKQSERVQELEEEVKRHQSGRNVAVITKMKMDELEQQNKRYKQALKFYADEEHYKEKLISEAQYDADGICISNDEYAPPIIYFDSGETARKALEGEE